MLDRQNMDLIDHLDKQIQPHRSSKIKQIATMPFRFLGRILTVRSAQLASRFGWTCAFRRKMFYGGNIRFPFPACWDLLVYRSYIDEAELRLLKYMVRHLPDGGQMIDVGANIGFVCQLASRLLGPQGQVFAFEPGEQALSFLNENLAGYRNVQIIPKAAMDVDGNVTFFEGLGAAMVSSSTVASHASDRGGVAVREVTIAATTLDIFCAQNEAVPDLIKVDVEGAELSVLRGAKGILANQRPAIILEVSFLPEEYESQYAPCIRLLTKAGYVPHVLEADGSTRPIAIGDVPERGAYCSIEAGYLHGLDNILFVHPERP